MAPATVLYHAIVGLLASYALFAVQTWTLTHPQAEYEDRFGQGVTVLDGAIFGGAPEAELGRVFRYERQGNRYMLAGEVIAVDADVIDNYGADIDADGTWFAVAAPPQSNLDGGGAVVMFEVINGGLSQRAVIRPLGDSEGDYFARIIDVDGETIVVWRYPEPEVYSIQDGVWTFEQAIVPSSPIESAVGALALDGDTLVVGDPFADVDMFEDGGRAYVFVREAGVWTEQASFTSEVLGFDSRFATAVGLDGDELALIKGYMGAWIEFYTRADATWTRTASFAPDVSGSYFFGERARLLGDRLVVSDGGSLGTSGTSVMFQRNGDTWPAAWVGPDGYGIGLEGDILVLGRPIAGDDEQGEVLVVELTGAAIGEPCSDNADCLGSACVDGVCCNQSCNGTCDACSVDAGAQEDGICSVIPAPDCCVDGTQCIDEDPCTAESCVEGECTYEDICCVSDVDCENADPCYTAVCLPTGFCDLQPIDGCAGTTSVSSSPLSVGDGSGGGDGSAGSSGDSGCGCRHAPPRAALLLLLLVGLARRRS